MFSGRLGNLGDGFDYGNSDGWSGTAAPANSLQPLDVVTLGPPLRYIDASVFYEAWAAWNANAINPGDGTGFNFAAAVVYPDMAGAQADFVAGIAAGDDRTAQANLIAIGAGSTNEIIPANGTTGWDYDYVWGSSLYKSYALTLGRALGLADAQTTAIIGGLMAGHWQDSFATGRAPFELGNSPLGTQFATALANAAGHAGDPTIVAQGQQLDQQFAAQRAIQGYDHGIFGGGFGAFLLIVATAGIASYALAAYGVAGAVAGADAGGAIGADAGVTSAVTTVVDDAGQAISYTAASESVGDATVVTAQLAAPVTVLDPVIVTGTAVAAPAALTAADVVAASAVAATVAAPAALDASEPVTQLDQVEVTGHAEVPVPDPAPLAPYIDAAVAAPVALDATQPVTQLDQVTVTGHADPIAPTPSPVVPIAVAAGAALTAAAIGAQAGDPYYSTQANADGSQSAKPLDSTPTPADLLSAGKTAASVASTASTIYKLASGSASTGVPGRAAVNPYLPSASPLVSSSPVVRSAADDEAGSLIAGISNGELATGVGVVLLLIVGVGLGSQPTPRRRSTRVAA